MVSTGNRLAALSFAAMACGALSADPVAERDLGRLAALLPGVYDNQEQVYFEPELDVPEPRRHRRLRQDVVALEAGAGERRLFEWRRYEAGAAEVSARGLWALSVDAGPAPIRMRRWSLPLQADVSRAAIDPGAIGSPLCDVLWRRRAMQFVGVTDPDCDDGAGDWLIAPSELQVAPAALAIDTAASTPFVLRRARPFLCWVAVAARDDGPWHFESDLALHDQGGMAWVDTDEPEPQRVGIRMRNVAWPTGGNRDSLVLYVHRDVDDAAAAYAWGEPEARRLAINLRWMQASCTLAE